LSVNNNNNANDGNVKLQKTIKITVGLLVALIVMSGINNVIAAYRFEAQKEYVQQQANQTRDTVMHHNANTEELLSIVKEVIANQSQLQPLWLQHLNTTGTAGPIVLQNNDILHELMNETIAISNAINASNHNSSNNNSNNNTARG